MKLRMVIMLVLVAAVLGGVFGFKDFVNGKIKEFMSGPAGPGHQPQTVSTIKAGKTEWQEEIRAVGSLRAVRGADLSLELAGVVDEINFQSGDDVEAGKVLLHLRDADDVAKLQSLEAQADLSQVVYDRDLKQLKAQAVSQAVIDTDAANLKNNRAQVEQQRAIVEKKTLKAPFAGHIGLRQVDLGQYLAAGTVIVTLQALTPIYADFFLPQQQISQIKVGQGVVAHVDGYPGQTFPGKITAINPKVETGSRNVQVRATLDNPDRKLLPGMYVTVTATTGAPVKLVTLPQTAITYNAYGDLVYVVDEKGKGPDGKPLLTVRQTFVTLGATRGDQVSVLKGIDDGATVVTSGQMKLRNGVNVVVNNSIQPKNDVSPKPVDN
ncbi:MAG TPA: efflux RND transporter periplasmic adaptor subunit [Reyranella sp.]|nr:efflux RND transporter periplasmic adaptor subunit [Reyranella sp.]